MTFTGRAGSIPAPATFSFINNIAASGVCLAINLIGNISGVQENGLYISMNISSVVFLITGGSLIAIGAFNTKETYKELILRKSKKFLSDKGVL